MIVEADNQTKLEELIKNKDESITVETGEHITAGSALAIYYSEGIKCRKNEYFCYR